MKGREKPLWEGNIVSGSLAQAQNAYNATDLFWKRTDDIGGRDVLADDPLVSITKYKNGAFFQIGTSSEKRQRGPHPNRAYVDEIDEIDVKVFNAAMFQSMTKNGYPASTALLSTMHRPGGLMADYVDHADERGLEVYKYCILEVMEACYDYRCDTCVLDNWCRGRMKDAIAVAEADQVADGTIDKGKKAIMGYLPVSDVIKKVRLGGEADTAGRLVKPMDVDAELFCLRPSRAGLVYGEFNDDHIIDDLVISDLWPRYRTFDFGHTNPWVSLSIATDQMDRVYVYDEIYVRGTNTMRMAAVLAGLPGTFEKNVADPSGAGDRDILLDHGITTVIPKKQNVAQGIQLIQHALDVRADGKPGLFVSSKCVNTIREFKSYRYPDDGLSENPVKENDHAMDALRNWFVVNRIGGIEQVPTKLR